MLVPTTTLLLALLHPIPHTNTPPPTTTRHSKYAARNHIAPRATLAEPDNLITDIDVQDPTNDLDVDELVELLGSEIDVESDADEPLDDIPINDDAAAAVDKSLIANFDVDKGTVDALAATGITHFTPIQAESYDILLSGQDVLGRSRTGTGKTLAFSLPLVQRIARETADAGGRLERGRLPRMIVLAPTRELARQVSEVLETLGRQHRLRVALFHGGVPYPPQQRVLRDGLDILVGTPGRIIDHLNEQTLNLSGCRYAVLDEADEMLNMGFKDDVETILEATADEDRQTVLFSATHPPWVRSIAREYQSNAHTIDAVGSGASEAATTVEHISILTPDSEAGRTRTLGDLISVYAKGADSRTIVFTSTKHEVDELCVSAAMAPYSAHALHGDISQKQRETTLKKFREGRFPVLIATDVAARGIDISGVDLIVQYRIPQDAESYVHRSGRTGRAGRSGVALLLHTERERRDLRMLERRAGVNFKPAGPPSVQTIVEAAVGLVPRRVDAVDKRLLPYFEAAAHELLEGPDALQKVSAMFALVSGQHTITQASLLTGEEGMTTMLLQSTDKSPLTAADAVAMCSQLGKVAGAARVGDELGKIRNCASPDMVSFGPSSNPHAQ